jgi:hypothetical protein
MEFKKYLIEEQENIKIIKDLQIENYFNVCNEIFDKSSNIKIIQNNKDFFSTTFIVDNVEFNVLIKIKNTKANILFFPIDDDLDIFELKKSKKYSGKIFASVFESVKIMLEKNQNVNEIVFVAENKQLEKLYNMMKSIISKIFIG